MSMLEVDLEWARCPDGYRITTANEHLKTGFNGDSRVLEIIKFASGKYFSELFGDESQIIAANSGRLVPYKVGADTSLYLAFSHVRTAQHLLKFITQHGSLFGMVGGDFIDSALDDAQLFRACLLSRSKSFSLRALAEAAARAGGDIAEVGKVVCSADVKNGMQFKLKPKDLRGLLFWQLARQLQGSTQIRSCRHCGTFFEVGANTGRRADATFCSKEHSVLYHSLARSKTSLRSRRNS